MNGPTRRPPTVDPREVQFEAIRAQGPGGQHVNKTSTAVQLRFDIGASSLPDDVKARLLARADRRRSSEGVLVIKAQTERSQEANKAEAMSRLQALVDAAAVVPLVRRPTRPTAGSNRRRLQGKAVRSEVKILRGKVSE
jgi:ribosome-associated protein